MKKVFAAVVLAFSFVLISCGRDCQYGAYGGYQDPSCPVYPMNQYPGQYPSQYPNQYPGYSPYGQPGYVTPYPSQYPQIQQYPYQYQNPYYQQMNYQPAPFYPPNNPYQYSCSPANPYCYRVK